MVIYKLLVLTIFKRFCQKIKEIIRKLYTIRLKSYHIIQKPCHFFVNKCSDDIYANPYITCKSVDK